MQRSERKVKYVVESTQSNIEAEDKSTKKRRTTGNSRRNYLTHHQMKPSLCSEEMKKKEVLQNVRKKKNLDAVVLLFSLRKFRKFQVFFF